MATEFYYNCVTDFPVLYPPFGILVISGQEGNEGGQKEAVAYCPILPPSLICHIPHTRTCHSYLSENFKQQFSEINYTNFWPYK